MRGPTRIVWANLTPVSLQYEFEFPAHALGVDAYASGYQFGLSVCINDGDTDGTSTGQAGWSGWAPYGIVVGGKLAENVGLATLVGTYISPPTIASWYPTTITKSAEVEVDDLKWNVPAVGSIVIDGELSDWGATDFKAQTPFRPCNIGRSDGWGCDNPTGPPAGTDFVPFQNWGGGTWAGVQDHSMAATMGWTPTAVYSAMKVIDDVHVNPGTAAEYCSAESTET